jgi:hypothetical protein
VVEQIEVAGNLDAREREAAERESTGKRRQSAGREQHRADDQQRRTQAEYESPVDQLHQ